MVTGAEIIAQAVQVARWNGVKVHYRHKSLDLPADATRGFPDLVLAGPGGVITAEVKGHGDQRSDAQIVWGELLTAAGIDYHLWTEQDWASKRIEHAIERLGRQAA